MARPGESARADFAWRGIFDHTTHGPFVSKYLNASFVFLMVQMICRIFFFFHLQVVVGQSKSVYISNNARCKSGYLTKEGGIVKNWKTRYFILSQTTLSYHEDESHDESIDTIPMSEGAVNVSVANPSVYDSHIVDLMVVCVQLLACSRTIVFDNLVFLSSLLAARTSWRPAAMTNATTGSHYSR
jgi:hypothetical protein